jgi:hypothetical protein
LIPAPRQVNNLQIHLMPQAIGRRRLEPAHVDTEVAIPVRGDPLLDAAEAGSENRPAHAAPENPSAKIDGIAAKASLPGAGAEEAAGLPENPAHDEGFIARPIAAVGIDHNASPALVTPHRASQQAKHPMQDGFHGVQHVSRIPLPLPCRPVVSALFGASSPSYWNPGFRIGFPLHYDANNSIAHAINEKSRLRETRHAPVYRLAKE